MVERTYVLSYPTKYHLFLRWAAKAITQGRYVYGTSFYLGCDYASLDVKGERTSTYGYLSKKET